MTVIRAVPTMRKRRGFMMGSAVYHAGAAPHLLDPILRAVVVPVGTSAKIVKRRERAAIAAARKEGGGR